MAQSKLFFFLALWLLERTVALSTSMHCFLDPVLQAAKLYVSHKANVLLGCLYWVSDHHAGVAHDHVQKGHRSGADVELNSRSQVTIDCCRIRDDFTSHNTGKKKPLLIFL
jgi:hypothetical protein